MIKEKEERRRTFRKNEIDSMWEKADKCPNMDPKLFRLDKCGNLIYKESYGISEILGWDGDHSKPLSKGGTYHPDNIQVLQYEQNRVDKRDKYPYDYENATRRGITKQMYDNIESNEIDKRSLLYKRGQVVLNIDGSVNENSLAVKSGYVTLNNDGSVRKNCKAVNDGQLILVSQANNTFESTGKNSSRNDSTNGIVIYQCGRGDYF